MRLVFSITFCDMKKIFLLMLLSCYATATLPAKGLKPEEIAPARARVWAEWQQLNTPENWEHGVWHLPDSLEPNADMAFHYITKGRTDLPRPLFLYLHGSGPRELEWAAGMYLCPGFDDAPSAYFIPRIPNEGQWYRWWQRSKQYAWEKLLREALASDNIDANRIYVFGISEGGYGSQRLASFYADYLAGAGPMAGGEPLRNAPVENCRNIAFSLLTGDKDFGFYRNKLTAYTAAAFDSLAADGGFTHRIELIPGRGHGIDYSPTTPWLKQYTRNPRPLHVSWEDFDMDGRHRRGFYNLVVNRRPELPDSVRMAYDMVIDTINNVIDLKAELVTYTTVETDPMWGIALKFDRERRRATDGELTVYLHEDMVDLSRPVKLRLNGREIFSRHVKPELRNLEESCEIFYDPERLFPAAIRVDLGRQTGK